MNDVTRALQEFIGIFDQLHITYAVIGGIAVRAMEFLDQDMTLISHSQFLAKNFRSYSKR